MAGRRRHDPAAADLLDGARAALAGDQRHLHRAARRDERSCSSRRWRLEQGRAAAPGGAARRPRARRSWARPSCSRAAAGRRATAQLNLYIWSNYIAPETRAAVRGAPRRARQRGPLRQQRGAAREAAGRERRLRRASARRTTRADPDRARACCARSTTRRCRTSRTSDPRFLDRPYDPGNRYSVPYFWGTTRHRLRRQSAWGPSTRGARCGTRATRGRILMLDDARETFGAALKWKGLSVNTTDPAPLRAAQRLLVAAEAARARLQLLELRGRAALGRRVARPGLERPVRARRWSRTRTSRT